MPSRTSEPQEPPAGISRRSFAGTLGAGGLGALGVGAAASAAHAAPAFAARRKATARRTAYLGTYGSGIITCAYDTRTGALTATGGFDAVTNPDFLALAPSGEVLYSLDERGTDGAVRAFSIGAGGELSPLGSARSTGGAGVTHLSVHPGGRHLLSANYTAGSVAVHSLEADGGVGCRTALVRHSGSGPDPDRQAGPHAHQILTGPDGAFVFAVDLGTDSVHTYALDGRRGALRPVSEVKSVPGAGPRHMVFHPRAPYAYVANELDSTITVCAYDAATGVLTRGESRPTLPDGTDPGTRNYPAEVAISADGRFVYLSNRGHDSVAWFAVEDAGASLRLVGTVPCGGSWPRHISLSPSGTLLFSANERANNVGVFTVDAKTGEPTPSGAPFATSSLGCVLAT
ncbi:lactonase family protein [Streptomyces sp. N2-109]|uniref:Lactonase family protein n=1 Tax=Streptomyces gossypii TaxID=2883101 RepID=A0ABT2JU31_9ACTN|nr:lactonase family protein [Streptomyces gossypii]MCT2591402.1 lactonase family protein [Streptomyces gossypii]